MNEQMIETFVSDFWDNRPMMETYVKINGLSDEGNIEIARKFIDTKIEEYKNMRARVEYITSKKGVAFFVSAGTREKVSRITKMIVEDCKPYKMGLRSKDLKTSVKTHEFFLSEENIPSKLFDRMVELFEEEVTSKVNGCTKNRKEEVTIKYEAKCYEITKEKDDIYLMNIRFSIKYPEDLEPNILSASGQDFFVNLATKAVKKGLIMTYSESKVIRRMMAYERIPEEPKFEKVVQLTLCE